MFLKTFISVHFLSLNGLGPLLLQERIFFYVIKKPVKISSQSLTHCFLCPSFTSKGPPKAREYTEAHSGDEMLKEKVPRVISGDPLPAASVQGSGTGQGTGGGGGGGAAPWRAQDPPW